MKKSITFLLASFLITTKLLAGAVTIPEASGRTGAQMAADMTAAVGAGNTDITLQLENGGTYGTSGVGQTIAVPAGVTRLNVYAPAGTMPTFYSGGLITFTDGGVMTRLIIDGVKVVTVGTSKALVLCTATTYPLGITIQNSYIDGFRYGLRGNLTPTAEFTNGILINNNIIKGISNLITGFSNVINTQTYTNNTFLDISSGTLIDYRTALNAGMNFTFSNNTVYSANTVNFGTNGLLRLVSDPGSPATGTYTINNNIIASGSAQTYAKGNYVSYPNLNFGTSYSTNNITYTANPFAGIQSYTGGIATLAPNYATYNLTIGDVAFTGKANCGDPRWYYPVSVTPSTSSLTGFSYNVGAGPSTSQTFTVSAVALRGAITLTAPSNYEISADDATFVSSFQLGTVGNDLPATTVYVRLKAGLAFAAYNNEMITLATSGLSTQNVSCSGNVLSGRTVLDTPDGLGSSSITNSGFTANWNAVANVSTYTVTIYQGSTTITTVTGISGTTTDITGLNSGNTYTFKVMAIGDGATYDNSLESAASSSIRLLGSYSTDLFRTKASGTWSDVSIWESSPNGGSSWADATLVPDGNASATTLLHDVTYAGTPASVANVTVSSGKTMTNTTNAVAVSAGKTLTIESGATFDNQIDNSDFSIGSGSMQINGTYKVSSYTGSGQLSFSGVTFGSSSTLYIGGAGAPRLPASNPGNVVWASAAGGSFLNTNPTTISGNLTITSALLNTLNHGTGSSVRVLTISGNLTINGGAYNPQGGSGTGTQALTVNGNVYLSGSAKLYAVNPLVTGLGTVDIKGNVYIQSPTSVELSTGGSSGTISLNGSTQQTISSDATSGYTIVGLTIANATGVTVVSNLTASSLTNNASSLLSVAAGKQLTVSSALTNNGTLKLLSNIFGTATILTPASISGSGSFSVDQYLTGANNAGTPNGRFWYVSSPVAAATSAVFTPSAGNKLWSHSEVGNGYTQIMADDVTMTPGYGYVARLKENTTVTFTGAPNTGDILVPVTRTGTTNSYRGFNLVGNPYPSFASINYVADVENSGIETSMWYRSILADNSGMVFDTYNFYSKEGISNLSGSGALTNYIPPMQAFWVKAKSVGTTNVEFKQANCSHQTSVKLRSTETDTTPRIRLQIVNGNMKDQVLIGMYHQAKDEFDEYDSHKMHNNIDSLPEIYTMTGNEELAINGLKHDGREKMMPLGFKTGKAGKFKLKVLEMRNMGDSIRVILKDKNNNCEKELVDTTSEYDFTSEVATTTDRFSIVLTSNMPTALNNASLATAEAYGTSDNQIQVRLIGTTNINARIVVYNTIGQQVCTFMTNSCNTVLSKRFAPGIYMVNIADEGVQVTKKVVINQ